MFEKKDREGINRLLLNIIFLYKIKEKGYFLKRGADGKKTLNEDGWLF